MATPVYTTMGAKAQDPLQVLICKAAFWAQTAAGAGPFPMGIYTDMTPFAQDPLQVLAAKLAYWMEQVAAGGGGGGGGGSGVTNSALAGVAPPVNGSVTTFWVYDTSTGFLWYNSGTLGAPVWNNV